jgi:hypothetical protein
MRNMGDAMGLTRPAVAALDETPPPRWETITVRTIMILSGTSGAGGLGLVLMQSVRPILSDQAFVVVGFWTLALACLGVGLAPHYAGANQRTAHLWRAVSALPERDLAALRAHCYRRPLVARPWLWRAASYFACACWVRSISYTAEVEGGALHPSTATLSVTLIFCLAGAIQGTTATFAGLDRARHERTYEIALFGAAVPGHTPPIDLDTIAAAALDEGRDDTGQLPKIRHLQPVDPFATRILGKKDAG